MSILRKDLEYLSDLPNPKGDGPTLILILALAILSAILNHYCK
jgi:hypothetical protein